MKSIRHVLLVGDLAGPEHFHVGDEAMLECNLQMLRRMLPVARFSVMSRDPDSSAARYDVQAVARPGFATVSVDRQVELHQIDGWLALAETKPEQLPEALQALLQADLLVISGGGNLSSTWPEYILERLALARLARLRGIPLLVLGQTLGPRLSEIDRALVGEILMTAQWLGLREAGSAALALGLGIPLANIDYQLDDATLLVPRPCPWLARAWTESSNDGPLIALTLHSLFYGAEREQWLDAVAAELDEVVAELNARFLFIPHLCDQQAAGDTGDRAVGLALAARLQHPDAFCVLEIQGSGETAWLTQQADLVVSSRYHPLVFALAGQRPCLGLPTDHYTLIKLQGVLSHAGREDNLLVIRDKQWSGLGQSIIARCRAAAEPLGLSWSTRLEQHGQGREKRMADWLLKLQQGLPLPPAGHGHDDLLRDLARLFDGAAQERLALAREAELRGVLEHWQQSAESAVAYAQDLLAALQRETAESASLRVALELSTQRAELAEQYAKGLEVARQAEAALYLDQRGGRTQALHRLRRLMRRLSRRSH